MEISNSPTISAIVSCHNYAHFLGDCLQSILGQSFPATEIIVVDDDSTDDPQKVIEKFKYTNIKYIKVSNRSIHRTQLAGIVAATSQYVFCIDADDTIDPFYLERGLSEFKKDYRIGLVYSDFDYRGLMQGVSNFPNSSLESDIQRSNFIHSASIIKKEVALLTDAFDHPNLGNYIVNWLSWRKVLRHGYWAIKQDSKYQYQRHENSLSIKQNSSAKYVGYYELAGLSVETITIVILVDAELAGWDYQRKFLLSQTWPHEQVRLFIVYNGDLEANEKSLREDVLNLPFNDIQFAVAPVVESDTKVIRENKIMQIVAAEADTPYMLYVDEYVQPPADAVEKLMNGMCENTISVSADFPRDSWSIISLKHIYGRAVNASTGVHRTAGNSFCCILFRTRYFKHVFGNQNAELSMKYSPESIYLKSIPKHFVTKINCDAVAQLIFDIDKNLGLIHQLKEQFDEQFYLENNPDVLEAIQDGHYKNGLDHFLKYGRMENRLYQSRGKTFDEEFYFKNYPDVRKAVSQGILASGLEHYKKYGEQEGRRAFFF